MIIGIDISSIPYNNGVSNYNLNLVKNLIKIDRLNIYKLFYSSFRQPISSEIKSLQRFPNVKIYRYYFPPSFLEFIWNRLHILPIEIFIGKCHVFHSWDWYQPPSFKAKSVTTVHDLVPLLFPSYQHPKTIATHRRKYLRSIQDNSHYICVSKNTQNTLLQIFPAINPSQTHLVYEAYEKKYSLFYRLSPQIKKRKLSIIEKQYDLNHYILAQGTREPRKNLSRLIKAFIKFKRRYPKSKLELAIAGKYGWGNDIDHLKHPYIKILGFIPEKDMVFLHAAATCLVYPSLYEGFGLPILKSMAVGVPVITSNTSSMPEVGGSAALYVNPASIDEITNQISRLYQSKGLRQNLIKKGLAQSHRFSWTKTAKQTLKVYQKIVQ